MDDIREFIKSVFVAGYLAGAQDRVCTEADALNEYDQSGLPDQVKELDLNIDMRISNSYDEGYAVGWDDHMDWE